MTQWNGNFRLDLQCLQKRCQHV
ncbi:hypothetical protein HID58_048006 [Brassica napus]|uniref:Uncharacterized protein n=1 Tax=Brassica napus TaxID=3708 RepID=A0ABQ8B179_BRANA|nr:hypothetical protein HID58_048006 [Brassica napus]